MNEQHTPGSWEIDDNYIISSIDGIYYQICKLSGRGDRTEANARLIAAAPELLAACEELLRVVYEGDWHTEVQPALDKAKVAIAKARGE
jgi:hypothetical protein